MFIITGSSKQVTLSDALLVQGAVTANTTLAVTGAATFTSNITAASFIRPNTPSTGSIGASNRYWANAFISTITVQNTGGVFGAGNVSGTVHHGTHANITNVNSTNVTATTVNASGYVKTAVFATTAARDSAITSPSAGMIVFVTTGTTFWGYNGSSWVALN